MSSKALFLALFVDKLSATADNLSEWLVRRTVSVSRASRSKTGKGRLRVALLLFYWPDVVAFGHDLEKFRARVATHTFKNGSIVNLVSVTVRPLIRVFNCLHGQISDKRRSRIHCADYLVNHVVRCVPVPNTAALIDVTSKEKYLCNYRLKIGILPLPVLVDGV